MKGRPSGQTKVTHPQEHSPRKANCMENTKCNLEGKKEGLKFWKKFITYNLHSPLGRVKNTANCSLKCDKMEVIVNAGSLCVCVCTRTHLQVPVGGSQSDKNASTALQFHLAWQLVSLLTEVTLLAVVTFSDPQVEKGSGSRECHELIRQVT